MKHELLAHVPHSLVGQRPSWAAMEVVQVHEDQIALFFPREGHVTFFFFFEKKTTFPYYIPPNVKPELKSTDAHFIFNLNIHELFII